VTGLGTYIWQLMVNTVIASHFVPDRVRMRLYALLGACACNDRPGRVLRTPNPVIGEGTTINHRCLFDSRALVTIGCKSGIAVDVKSITSTHDMSDPAVQAVGGRVVPIAVDDGAWIGTGATIFGGVMVGNGAVVTACPVVARDASPHTLVGDFPARIVRELSVDAP
jgi:maltose O-acetyltransferase